jgi:hypothetical protein
MVQQRNTLAVRALLRPWSMKTSILAGCTLFLACASGPPPKLAEPSTQNTLTSAEVAPAESSVQCDLVCQGAELADHTAISPDYTARAVADANRVFDAMHDDLLACYRTRLSANPGAHAFITVDVVIAPDGRVRGVETTGGANLGEATMHCIVRRVQRAHFEPVHGGGTLRFHVPFAFRRVGPDEAI